MPLAAFIAVVPLLLRGASCGHDFDFHILNWIEVAAQWKQGIPYPHWAVTPAFGAGEPRFIFYPPLSWALGALLGLILPLNAVPAVYTFIVLTCAGFSLYTLAREWAQPRTALLAAIVYTVNPYMLFTAYERTAYAELLAAVWMPLLLLAVLRRRPNILGVAVPVALLWLTNAPAAVMGCYALALLTVVRLLMMFKSGRQMRLRGNHLGLNRRSVNDLSANDRGVKDQTAEKNSQEASRPPTHRPLLFAALMFADTIFTGTLLGLALAAFYIVPAAYEQRWVQINMATVTGMRIQDSFLFGHTADPAHDAVLWTASCIAVLFFLVTAVATWFANSREHALHQVKPSLTQPQPPEPENHSGGSEPVAAAKHTAGSAFFSPAALLPLIALTLFIAVMLFPISRPLWNHLPELRFLQFPWRWIAVLSVAMSLVLSFALRPLKPGMFLSLALLLPLVLVPATNATFQQACDAEDTPAAQLNDFRSGQHIPPTDEYTPVEADNDALKIEVPEYWLGFAPGDNWPQVDIQGDPNVAKRNQPLRTTVRVNKLSAEHWSITAHAKQPEFILLRLRDYPAWRITVNGHLLSPHAERDDGLLAIPISEGDSDVDIRYAATPDVRIGEGISLVALLILLWLAAMPRFKRLTNAVPS